MWRFEHTELTEATPDRIWDRWCDLASWPDWDHGLAAIVPVGPLAVGSTFSLRPKHGPSTIFTCTELTPGLGFTAIGHPPGAALALAFRVEASGHGARFTHAASLSGPMAPVLAQVVGRQIARGLPPAMAALAELSATSPPVDRATAPDLVVDLGITPPLPVPRPGTADRPVSST